MAELFEVTAVAFGLAGIADLAAMVDELVGEVDPAAWGDDPHQFLLDFLGRVAFGQAESAGDAEDVRIHHDALSLLEADTEDDVGGFAGGAGNGDQLRKGLRHLAPKVLDHLAGGALDGFGLVVEEAGGAYESFEFRQSGFGHCGWGGEATEQLWRYHVDAHVCALG